MTRRAMSDIDKTLEALRLFNNLTPEKRQIALAEIRRLVRENERREKADK